MKRLLPIMLLLAVAGCDIQIEYATTKDGKSMSGRGEVPVVNLPMELRQWNWQRNPKEGSCVHATMVMLLRWQAHPQMAAWWRKYHVDGTWPERFEIQLNAANVRYADTFDKNDVAFLEWSIKTHRGCGVAINKCRHMVALVHLDNNWAGLLDNNYITRDYLASIGLEGCGWSDGIIWVPRDRFLDVWLNSRSWAVTPVYTPSPPLAMK